MCKIIVCNLSTTAFFSVVPGLGLQTSLNPMPLGRTLSREQESPTAFTQTSSLQGLSMPLMGGTMGADGIAPQGVRSQLEFLRARERLCSITAIRKPQTATWVHFTDCPSTCCQVSLLGDPPKELPLPQNAFLGGSFSSGDFFFLNC